MKAIMKLPSSSRKKKLTDQNPPFGIVLRDSLAYKEAHPSCDLSEFRTPFELD